ncbi:MAG: arylamine N-acetyltransferase [Spirochaetaceae bacterium]|jgi:N-hydroxyarylamine O-acetyltransferase|nr:arylamine N-acetyltransferase [Spirochaetaceae bacterium]
MEYRLLNPEYFAPIPDISRVLTRIGLDPDEDLSPSVAHLSKIMLAHMMTVPYENLDISDYHRQIDFSPPHLFEKFVVNRRGGYCYEINGFFMGILQALGYTCYALSGRLLFGKPVAGPMSHRTTIVTIGGAEYLCDVGYGAGCAEGPVRLDEPGVQTIMGSRFSIRHHDGGEFGDMTLVKHTKRGEEEFYTVYKQPHTPLEFIAQNYHTSMNPASPFRAKRVVRLRTETGSIVVDNTTFRRKVNGEVYEETIPSYARLYEILTGEFGMVVPRLSFSADFPRVWFFTGASVPAEDLPLPAGDAPVPAHDGQNAEAPSPAPLSPARGNQTEGAGERRRYRMTVPEYFLPLPDLDAALARIGLTREDTADRSAATVGTIMWAMLRTVPFENLDIYDYKRRVDFCLPHLFEKIVLNRRGGYCYELNSFFTGILEALGYECRPLGGRLLFGSPPWIMAQSHRTAIVIVDGKQYLCDVGFGGDGNAEGPVCVDDAGIQEIRGRRFQVERHPGEPFGDVTLYRITGEGKEPFITVYARPHTVMEFIAQNYYLSNNPSSRFTTNRMARLFTETGSIAIDNKIYRRRINGEVFEEEITSAERLYRILTDDFKMVVPKMGLSADFPRVWF